MSRWFRWYRGTSENPKFRLAARNGGVTLVTVMAVWQVVLEDAANEDHRGVCCKREDFIAAALDLPDDGTVEAALRGLEYVGLISVGHGDITVSRWKEWQFEQDVVDPTNADRQRRFRERKRAENANITPRNGAVTADNTPDTDTDTDTDTEKNITFTLVNEPAAVEPPTARQRLWSEGIATLQTMGVKPQQARAIVGKWLKDTNDDIDRILGAIQRAREDQVVNPIPWITAGLTQPKAKRDARTDRNTQWLATLSGDAEQTNFIDGDFEVVGTDDRLRLAPRRD